MNGHGGAPRNGNGLSTDIESKEPHPSELLQFATIQSEPVQHVEVHTATDASDGQQFHGQANGIPAFRRLSVDAQAGLQAERDMNFTQGVRLYPKAIAWSLLLSATIIMEGYGGSLVNSFFAFPVFRRAYGSFVPDHGYQISSAWQAGLLNGATVADIAGLFLNGYFTERFGYQKTMCGALLWMALSIFLFFFAYNIHMLLAAQISCGFSWGIFQTLSTTYAAEVMPVTLRAYLTSSVNLCWLIGQILGVAVIRGLFHFSSEWAYRIPFGLQWVFAVPILIGVFLAPESPWWLIRHERPADAKTALLRLAKSGESNFNADETVALMQHTNEVEKDLNSGVNFTYLDCFRGSDLRRTEIACMVWISQSICGSSMTGFAPYFYEQAGFSPDRAFDLAIGMYGLAILGGLLAWVWMRKLGRRFLYLTGLTGCFLVLILAGILGTRPQTAGVSWTLGSLLILLTFIYDSTIGPVCYTLVAEIPSTRLRVKTVVLARVAYNLASLVVSVITSRSLNPTAWNWKARSCFLWAGTTLVALTWCYYRLPEPKGLSYFELDLLFQKKANAKKFKQVQETLADSGYFSLAQPEAPGAAWRGFT